MNRIKTCCTSLLFLVSATLCAQTNLPIIKSNVKSIDIRDGENYKKGTWSIVPETKPDIYQTSNAGKTITFITDIDSISFNIERNGVYDFIVLYNSDTAYTQIKWVPSRLEILKAASAYNYNDSREIPKFTYQSADDADLVRLRKAYNLDSIAGNGNEVSKFINLMRWVHNVVRHDGGSRNPELKNTFDLIRVCKEENRGINCRMMAMMLNECYLAMGFKSHYVTCMPREAEFDDCHVINMVYSNDLQKWIWMDPTFAAYVMDENGTLLGLDEVRERLINDKPLILNPDANWNYKTSQTKEEYLETYMAKNLYRMQIPIRSCFNSETIPATGKRIDFIELLPLDALAETQKGADIESKDHLFKSKTYTTNNPSKIVAKPE